MRKMFMETYKGIQSKYSKTEEAERQVLELKRLYKLCHRFPLENIGNADLSEILLNLERAIEYLQKPTPDFSMANAAVEKADSILNSEMLH